MEVTHPLVSIVCTVKNGSSTLPAVIESILAQTFGKWELIILDDGSEDETRSTILAAAAEDPRIRPILTSGVGRASGLARCIRECRAPLVANIDADDPSHPQRLEIQMAAMRNSEFEVICTIPKPLLDNEVPIWRKIVGWQTVTPSDVTPQLAHLNPINHSSVLMQREAVLSVGNYDVDAQVCIDYELWVRLAEGGYRIGRLPLPLASKRIHEAQSFERPRRLAYISRSAKIQVKAIRVLGGGTRAWLSLCWRSWWSMLPLHLRGRIGRRRRSKT